MVEDFSRTSGSVAEFERDWHHVLETLDDRYLIFPTNASGRQVDFLEWVKARQIDKILRDTALTSGRTLEYGCGSAGISLYLAQKGYETHICDLSEKAIGVAELNRLKHAPDTAFASSSAADAVRLPFSSDSFDVVMSYGLLEHFEPEPLSTLLDEVVRVIRPGGLFIADIVPGPERLNARTLGIIINFVSSSVFHIVTGRWRKVPDLYRSYFDYFYENTYDDKTWTRMLREHGLTNVTVDVCRPFPVLAVEGRLERIYTGLLSRLSGLHFRFDGANNWFTRRWGWMYLGQGVKPFEGSRSAGNHP